MTQQTDILNDKNFKPVLNKGFVGIVDIMGDDNAIAQAARVSYAKGTKAVSTNRGLIRYLMRNWHSTPFEMAEIKLHVKLPLFVARQWMRHRTFSYNEISYRYSEIEDDFYMPSEEVIMPQSVDNKQGRAGTLSQKNKLGVKWIFNTIFEHSMTAYKILLGEKEKSEDWYDVYEDDILDPDYQGVAKELARCVVSTSIYTEFYCKGNLKNWLHFIKLRDDPHAQYEIRVYANAIFNLLKEKFPLAIEAFEDYQKNGYSLSRMDKDVIQDLVQSGLPFDQWYSNLVITHGSDKDIAKHFGSTEREFKELKEKVFNIS